MNPDPGHPHGETLPDESEPEGKAALRKGDVEFESPEPGESGTGDPSRERDAPNGQ